MKSRRLWGKPETRKLVVERKVQRKEGGEVTPSRGVLRRRKIQDSFGKQASSVSIWGSPYKKKDKGRGGKKKKLNPTN